MADFATAQEWLDEGERRYGKDYKNWKFKCPKCGRINSGLDFYEAGADANAIYCECIGRYDDSKGCDWAAYGFLDICTTHVAGKPVFDFAK